MGSGSCNWYYDWSTIVKNDARCVVEVRQYNSLTIPSTIPWKIYDPSTPIPLLWAPTGSTQIGLWTFMATGSMDNVYDLSGNGGTLINSKAAPEVSGLSVSRRALYPILNGGVTGYNLTSDTKISTPNTSFSWETYVYGMDAHNSSSGLMSLTHTSSGDDGYAIIFDLANSTLSFTVGSASISETVDTPLTPYLAESGFPANYHYVAGSFLAGSGLFLYVDGELKSFAAYSGGVASKSVALSIRNGESLAIDELSIWSGFLDENTAAQRYTTTKERQRYLGLPSGSCQPYHQARFTVFASGSQEFELHSFSLRGLQNITASIFDPRQTDMYSFENELSFW